MTMNTDELTSCKIKRYELKRVLEIDLKDRIKDGY